MTTRINLLPWRETLRKERKRQFASIAGGVSLLMLVIVFYAHLHVGAMIEHQNSRNTTLETEIAKVDESIKEISELETKKTQLLNRMTVIQDLQTRRPLSVHLLDELVRTLPDGLVLTKVTQMGTALNLEGMAQSNARISAFMRNLEASAWFSNPNLDVIQAQDKSGNRVSKFVLKVKQLTPDEVEKKKTGAAQ
jgi:type IV pilus assembly protein PilN